jgi:hypothetical protein
MKAIHPNGTQHDGIHYNDSKEWQSL